MLRKNVIHKTFKQSLRASDVTHDAARRGRVKYNCLLQFHSSRNEAEWIPRSLFPVVADRFLSCAIPGLRVNLTAGERMRDAVPRGNEQSE